MRDGWIGTPQGRTEKWWGRIRGAAGADGHWSVWIQSQFDLFVLASGVCDGLHSAQKSAEQWVASQEWPLSQQVASDIEAALEAVKRISELVEGGSDAGGSRSVSASAPPAS